MLGGRSLTGNRSSERRDGGGDRGRFEGIDGASAARRAGSVIICRQK